MFTLADNHLILDGATFTTDYIDVRGFKEFKVFFRYDTVAPAALFWVRWGESIDGVTAVGNIEMEQGFGTADPVGVDYSQAFPPLPGATPFRFLQAKVENKSNTDQNVSLFLHAVP